MHPLKRPLVLIWNAVNHALVQAVEIGGSAARGQFERCNVCGQWSLMVRRPRVIPPRLVDMWGLTRRQARALLRKESLDCLRCGAKLRGRRLAQVVVRMLFDDAAHPPESLSAWVRTQCAQRLTIAEINRIDGVHQIMAGLPGLRYSDYNAPGVPHEDLTRLSYPDETFDLVLTSETLEHVPDLNAAIGEIRRVLRPGGLHIFTIPLLATVERTFARARLGADGTIEPLRGPLLHHPAGDAGYPVFTEFGLDFADRLSESGFEVQIHFLPVTDDDVAQVWVARKVQQPVSPG
jgi:SAM-dependent methyltransferase